jgi:4-amino-4-deoxychorismate lyase
MSLLFETIKIINGIPQNLTFHEERMNRSRNILLGKSDRISLSEYLSGSRVYESEIERCRVKYDDTISEIEYTPYRPSIIRTLRIVNGDDLIYDHKFSDRSKLTVLLDKSVSDEVLILKENRITDTSISNIIFFDGTDWITPYKPLLRGTMRESLLKKGTIKQAEIKPEDLKFFSHFRLINALLGFEAPIFPVSNIINL